MLRFFDRSSKSSFTFLSTVLFGAFAQPALAWFPIYHVSAMDMIFQGDSGTIVGENLYFSYPEAKNIYTYIDIPHVKGELEIKNERLLLHQDEQDYDLGTSLKFIGSCAEGSVSKVNINVAKESITASADALRRRCVKSISQLSKMSFQCKPPELKADEPDEAESPIIDSCLAGSSSVDIERYDLKLLKSPPFYLKPLFPRSIQNIHVSVKDNTYDMTFTLYTMLSAIPGHARGSITHGPERSKVRAVLKELSVGTIPMARFLSLLPLVYDPHTLHYGVENGLGYLELDLNNL